MVWGLRRVDITWKLLGNDSGMILELLETDSEPFSNRKFHIWDIVPEINSQNEKSQNLISKSQHLVMNPTQGPHLKCAPGHKSMEDSSIIKSY